MQNVSLGKYITEMPNTSLSAIRSSRRGKLLLVRSLDRAVRKTFMFIYPLVFTADLAPDHFKYFDIF